MKATSGNNGAWQQVSVNPNTTYTLTAWGKKDSTLANLMIFVKNYGGAEIDRYIVSTSYAQNYSITFKPTVASCTIGVWAWNGSGYGYADDFVLTSSSPPPKPTPTPSPAVVKPQVWIAVRTDGLPGIGTQLDPFNGSTAAKFDAIMFNYYWTYNLRVHLVGPGPFRTDAKHRWFIRPGWELSGDGMYSTTIQVVGNVAGVRQLTCVSSDPNISTDFATIRDLTIDCNWAQLSTTADNGVGGEKKIKVNAISIWGSNNLIERVRSINTYGSWANQLEHFDFYVAGPRSADGTRNVIQFCRAELPHGNYGNPFALAGWSPYRITNSKVFSCTAVGVNNGLATGFTSGGVNLSNVKDCWVDSNTFTDCFGAAYTDVGSVDGLHVINNTVTRGWCGVGISTRGWPKQNIEISGNNLSIQNRVSSGCGYGIITDYTTTTNVTMKNNTISFDSSGRGFMQFAGVGGFFLNSATISDNTIGLAPLDVGNSAWGSGLTMFNNHNPDGTLIPGLNNQ